VVKGILRQRIGPALVAEGIISPEQLRDALQQQERHPSFLLGEIISILHRVPIEIIDDVNIRSVVLPLFPEVLRQRLKAVAQRDKFAKGLDIETFVADIQTRRLSFEAMHVETRTYAATATRGRFEKTAVKRYVLTQVRANVTLIIGQGDQVNGVLNAKHDSDSQALTIIEDDDLLKTALYYDLRNIFNQKYATHPS